MNRVNLRVPDLYLESRRLKAEKKGYSENPNDQAVIDVQIKKVLDRLLVRDCEVTIQESERLLLATGMVEHVVSGNDEMDQMNLTSRSTMLMDAFGVTDLSLKGYSVTFKRFAVRLRVYRDLTEYLTTWARRISIYPNVAHPPMEDFIKIDEYLRQEHKECMLYAASVSVQEGKNTPPKLNRGSSWNMTFSDARVDDEKEVAPTGTVVMPYQSIIDQFPQSVWSL